MTAYQIISEKAEAHAMHAIAESERPVIYTLLDYKCSTLYRGTYKEVLAYLAGVRDTEYRYEGRCRNE